jgi:hypothetical protein
MKSVHGKYDGNKIILEEEAPVKGETRVIVTFLDENKSGAAQYGKNRIWNWEQSRKLKDGFKGSVVELLLKERRDSF